MLKTHGRLQTMNEKWIVRGNGCSRQSDDEGQPFFRFVVDFVRRRVFFYYLLDLDVELRLLDNFVEKS